MQEMKAELIQQALSTLQELLDEIRREQKDLLTSISVQQDSVDLQEQSLHDEAAGHVERDNQQAIHIEKEIGVLESISTRKKLDKVEFGALVKTDSLHFFISVPKSDLTYQGKKIVGISTQAPIYQVMRGKTKGEQFTFNDTTYKIEEIS